MPVEDDDIAEEEEGIKVDHLEEEEVRRKSHKSKKSHKSDRGEHKSSKSDREERSREHKSAKKHQVWLKINTYLALIRRLLLL